PVCDHCRSGWLNSGESGSGSEARHRRVAEGLSIHCYFLVRRRNAKEEAPWRRQSLTACRATAPYARFQREKDSTLAARSAFLCRLATSPFAAGMIGLSPQCSSKESVNGNQSSTSWQEEIFDRDNTQWFKSLDRYFRKKSKRKFKSTAGFRG